MKVISAYQTPAHWWHGYPDCCCFGSILPWLLQLLIFFNMSCFNINKLQRVQILAASLALNHWRSPTQQTQDSAIDLFRLSIDWSSLYLDWLNTGTYQFVYYYNYYYYPHVVSKKILFCYTCINLYLYFCSAAVPTIFNVPAHLQKENKQRRPPKVRTAAATVTLPSMLTSASTSFGELDEQSGTTPEDNSTIQPTSGVPSIVNEHRYGVLESPMKLKRRLNTVNKALESYHKRLKLSQQRSRRLAKKVKSMETVIRDLKEKNLLSQQAAENLSASFSGGALELIKRCMNKGQNSKAVYPAELRAFALTLQFYSARAYDYVRQTFNNCLPHPKTLSEWYSCINGDPGFHDEIFAALKEKAEQCDGGKILCSFMMVLSKTVLFKGQ